MKLLHTSHLHLGRHLYGRRRHHEFAAFLDWLAATLEAEQVDVLVIAGDVFDTATPSPRSQAQYYQFLCRIAADARVQSVLTVGAQWHSRDTPREMMASLTVADVRGQMSEQVAAYQKHNPRPDLDALVADLRRLWTDDTAAGFPNENTTNIKAPVLAVRGEDDFLLSAEALNSLRQVLPEAHLMNVPFAAHEVIKEQPEILWAAMKVFYKL